MYALLPATELPKVPGAVVMETATSYNIPGDLEIPTSYDQAPGSIEVTPENISSVKIKAVQNFEPVFNYITAELNRQL
jgi:hypothetical protein